MGGLDFLFNALIGISGFVLAFGLAVLVHELGHFLAAKAFKVPVERFVIGFDKEAMPFMPRCIFEKKWGETTYGLSLVPLGGYVKMAGTIHPEIEAYLDGEEAKEAAKQAKKEGAEAPPPAAANKATAPELPAGVRPDTLTGQAIQDQTALYQKPFWQKFIIYSAGVFMNLVLAALVLAFMNWRGVLEPIPQLPQVAWHAEDSWAAEQGFRTGDQLLGIDDERVQTDLDFRVLLRDRLAEIEEGGNFAATIHVLRDGEEIAIPVEMPWPTGDAPSDAQMGLGRLVAMPAFLEYVIPDRAGWKDGLRQGDEILAAEGESISDWFQLVEVIRGGLNQNIELDVRRAPQTMTLRAPAAAIAQGDFQAEVIRNGANGEEHRRYRMPATVAWLPSNSPFAEAGLQKGDSILAINGETVRDRDHAVEMIASIAEETGGRAAVQLDVLRNDIVGRGIERKRLTASVEVELNPNEKTPLGDLLSMIPVVGTENTIQGFEPGDRIIKAAGRGVEDYAHLRYLARAGGGGDLTVEIERSGTIETLVVTPVPSGDDASVGALGIMPGSPFTVRTSVPATEALLSSPMLVANTTQRYVQQLGNLASRAARGDIRKVREDLGGPVGIARMAGVHATMSLDYYLRFLIILNIALAVINILPLPILDGGHIVLAAYEGIVGRPMPPKILVPVLNGALFLLLGFVVLVTFSDVLKIFTRI